MMTTTRITSRNGTLILTSLLAVGVVLALLNTIASQGLSVRTAAASLLILCFFVFTFGGVLYAGRAFLNWQIGKSSAHLIWERGFVIGGILFTVLGLALLEEMLQAAGDFVLSRVGMITYLFGAVIVVVTETTYLSNGDWVYPQVVTYVVLAFLAQAAFGVALLQTGLTTAWAAWATIIWNVAWLFIMLIVRPRDIYFPVLHHVAPLMIGIGLLVQR